MSYHNNFILILAITSALGCTTQPPIFTQNICKIFEDRTSWEKAALNSQKRWGIPLETSMAFIYHESHFQATAKPERKKFLWVIPCPICKRKSSSYGYAQAIDTTWEQYVEEAGWWLAKRTSCSDAIDFIGWYNKQSATNLNISGLDAKELYLAYHEGQKGYRKGSYKQKPWLVNIAGDVQLLSNRYKKQYMKCKNYNLD